MHEHLVKVNFQAECHGGAALRIRLTNAGARVTFCCSLKRAPWIFTSVTCDLNSPAATGVGCGRAVTRGEMCGSTAGWRNDGVGQSCVCARVCVRSLFSSSVAAVSSVIASCIIDKASLLCEWFGHIITLYLQRHIICMNEQHGKECGAC